MANVIVRHANSTDDYQKIAACIYLTDPFIYPAAFGTNIQKATCAISKLMTIENGLLHPDNIVLSLCDDIICGVLLYNKNGATWDLTECIDAVHEIIPNVDKFVYVSDAYFSVEAVAPPSNHIEVIACCVMPEFRNMGIGNKMLEWLIGEYPKCTLTLDVLANNSAALRLYTKWEFEIVEEMKGFSLEEESRPDCYRMVRYKV